MKTERHRQQSSLQHEVNTPLSKAKVQKCFTACLINQLQRAILMQYFSTLILTFSDIKKKTQNK